MKSDRLWNEIQPLMKLEQPSDTFTDQVMVAIEAAQTGQHAQASTPVAPSQGNRKLGQGSIQSELMNALLASAATFLFFATGLWSNLISLQGGQFGLAVRETVTNTLYSGIDLLANVINWL